MGTGVGGVVLEVSASTKRFRIYEEMWRMTDSMAPTTSAAANARYALALSKVQQFQIILTNLD